MLLCFVAWPVFSQFTRYYQNEFYTKNYHVEKSYVYKDDHVDSFALSRHIRKIELSVTTFNDKHSRKFTYLNKDIFDRNGRVIEQMNLEDTGRKQKIGKSNTRTFNEDGNITYASYFSYGRNYFKMFEYNDSLQLIKQLYYNDKGVYSIVETAYDAGNLYNSRVYRNKKGKITYRYHYYYYPNKQFRQIVLSDKKGKIQKVWDYSCDETGKGLKKLKDTAKICTLKSYLPDGTVVTTTQSFDFSGKPWKTIQHADVNGKTTKYQYYLGKEEKLTQEYVNTYVGNKQESRMEHYYGSHRSYKREIKYDTSGRIVSEIYTVSHKSKKKVYKTNYVYNEQGLMTERNTFVNDRLKTNEKYRYEFYTKN